jgi:hypothetical protein
MSSPPQEEREQLLLRFQADAAPELRARLQQVRQEFEAEVAGSAVVVEAAGDTKKKGKKKPDGLRPLHLRLINACKGLEPKSSKKKPGLEAQSGQLEEKHNKALKAERAASQVQLKQAQSDAHVSNKLELVRRHLLACEPVGRNWAGWVDLAVEVVRVAPREFEQGNWAKNWVGCEKTCKCKEVGLMKRRELCSFHALPWRVRVHALLVSYRQLTARVEDWDGAQLMYLLSSGLFPTQVHAAALTLLSGCRNKLMHQDLELDQDVAYQAMSALLEALNVPGAREQLAAHKEQNASFWPARNSYEEHLQARQRADWLTKIQWKAMEGLLEERGRWLVEGHASCGKTFLLVKHASCLLWEACHSSIPRPGTGVAAGWDVVVLCHSRLLQLDIARCGGFAVRDIDVAHRHHHHPPPLSLCVYEYV